MFSTKKQTDIYVNKLFSNIDEKKVKFNFSLDNIITFNEGEVIFKKNEKSSFIYLILEGEVKLKIPNPPFSPKVLHKYKNEFFGEKELLEKKPRVSSCVAETDCQVYRMSVKELQYLISENKTVRDNLEMVTIASEGKTLQEITQESLTNEEEIDPDKAIKVHPDKPITKPLVENIKTEEITLENIFKTDEIETKEKKTDTFSNINILNDELKTEEQKTKEEIKEATIEKVNLDNLIEKETSTEEKIPNEKLKQDTVDIITEETTEEIKPEEKIEKISEEKYQQIIESGYKLFNFKNIDDLTEKITKQALELVGADRSILFFINEDEKLIKAKVKENGNDYVELKIPMSNSIVGLCALRNKIAIIDDVSSDDRFNPIYDEVFNYESKNLLVFPIADKDEKVIVLLELINSKEENFTENDIEIIKLFSKCIVLSLKNCENVNRIISTTEDESLSRVSKYIYNDIKNPLQTIKNYAKILSQDKLPKEINEVLQLIIKQTNFVDALSDNLSTLNEEKIDLKLKTYPFKDAMNDILGMLAEYTESRNIELYKKIESEVKVKIDLKQFMVACYQIIKNSCDAQSGKGSVYVTSFIDEGNIKIEFKDSGEGVSDELSEKILNKYTSFKNDDSFGVGLNIAEKIIKAHKGELSFSNSEEGGAVFTISLPSVND